MPKKRKLLSVNEKCRVCLGEDGCMGDIFAEDLRPKINDLAECTSIDINDNDNFPRKICHVCLYKLDMWIDFKKQFLRSNVMLREHLELSELSDNAASMTKRKHSALQDYDVDAPRELEITKKLKSEVASSSSVNRVSPEGEKAITKLCTANAEAVTNEESLEKKIPESIAAEDQKENSENGSDAIPLAASVSPKVKQIIGRRAKTTERRKASTKRWVARKKALLAATGENTDTDTDSMTSDDSQLSPVQKARAKCNAEKVADTHRRMSKALHSNLDSNISGYYGTCADSDSYVVGDTDSENKAKTNDASAKMQSTPTNGSGQQVRLSPNNNVDEKIAKNSMSSSGVEARRNSKFADDDFLPNSVRSELIVDDATFIVTSTLVLSDPHCSNPAQPNNSANAPAPEDTNRERNTDIIDAVQLRRVSPKSPEKRDKKFVESCLNIEVEGTELDALQRVQTDLANFVENDMKNIFSQETLSKAARRKVREAKRIDETKDSCQTLDRHLRTIVEKAIKQNLENTRNIARNRGDKTFTSEFVRAALRSKIFQPRVALLRLDATQLLRDNEKKTASNNAKATKIIEKHSIGESLSVSRGKRRCVQPIKFADYDTSPMDTELNESRESNVVEEGPNVVKEDLNFVEEEPNLIEEEPKISTSPGPKSSKVKTYGPASAKQILPSVNQREMKATKIIPQQPPKNSSPVTTENSPKISPSSNDDTTAAKHFCGLCGDSFSTCREVEIHLSSHKNSANASKQSKQKMMRCKRCHEIVEARYVKLHVCRALRSIYKCYSCNSSFKTENVLARHLASHGIDDRDGKIDPVPRMEPKSKTKVDRVADEANGRTNERGNSQPLGGAARDIYTCFVCDKTFTDEEILKDHLQKHCDDMSDDQRSNGKDYQCAICGESLDSEDALETHVEKHLFDDEDDNPNLISIGGNSENEKIIATARCGQCAEEFDSEMLLMLHMQAHDEEVAIAEWERRGIDNSQHICVICDDVFATEIELSDHLEVHNGNAHICQLCDKPFLTLEELQSHVNTH